MKNCLKNPMRQFADGGQVASNQSYFDKYLNGAKAALGMYPGAMIGSLENKQPNTKSSPNMGNDSKDVWPVTKAYADGGAVQETPEQLMARIQAKYGVSGNAAPAPAPASQPAPQPTLASPNQSSGLLGKAIGIFSGRKAQIDKAAGYRNGGKIKGPGTPTSDSIPAKVKETGEPIKVSTSERILSQDQDQMLEQMAQQMGFDSLDAMLEHGTGKPVGPTMKGGTMAAADGMAPDDTNKPVFRGLLEPRPVGNFDPQTYKGVVPILPGVAPGQPVNQLGGDNPLRAVASILPNDSPLRRTIETNTAGNPNYGNEGRSVPTPIASTVTQAPSAPAASPEISQPVIQESSARPGVSVQDVGNGINKITGNGLNSPFYTNLSDPQEAIAGLKEQVVPGASDEGLQRMKNANAIRQSMIDEQAGKSGMIGDTGQVAASNALLDKFGRQTQDQNLLASLSGMSPRRAGIMAQIYSTNRQSDTASRGQDLNYQTALANQNVAERGQDLNALSHSQSVNATLRGQDLQSQTAANHLAGNPLDQEAKRLDNASKQRIAALQAVLSDPAATQEQKTSATRALLALHGKDPFEQYTFHTIGGGVNEMGMPNPQGLVIGNKSAGTYQIVSQNADKQAIPPLEKRVVGQTYDTPKGPMIWRGNGWEAAK